MRSSTTDLPEYSAIVTYSVSNTGNADASSIEVTVRVDGEILSQQPISVLRPSGEYTGSFSLSMEYDSSNTVAIDASCSSSSDSTSIVLDASLLRSPSVPSDQELSKLYITPNEVNVSSTEDNIVSNKFLLLPNWVALRDWVGNNIDYKYDSEAHGKTEFWQLPHETLQLRTGDCEGFSILLCSLLRANGWSENDVYVVLGEQDGSYHAWVKINLGVLGWYNIEPQADGWNTLIGDFLSLPGYASIGYFNDTQFHWTG
ncbi:MAG TPA: transglutaminase domain-containing protein [Candidatus Bathyarchaeia archaeon]|nr:transglutaminase domain-containing protein [Candidatus Bathyarchaeia archaeon]